MPPIRIRFVLLVLILAILLSILNCASKGLVSEKYDENFYRVPRLLPDEPITENQTFLVYSDNQSGWRGHDKFLRKENWTSRKMFIVPFYQLYLIGNGLVGTVNWIRHVPDYGHETRTTVRDAIYTQATNSNAAFIMNIGDISAHDGRRPSHWEVFLKENRVDCPLLDEIPFLPVIGNHENANDETYGFPNYDAIFDYPRFYVVEFTDAALFVLDSNFLIDQKEYIPDDRQDELFEKWFVSSNNSTELSWLEKQLTAYDKRFKIVAMHHPPITCGMHSGDWSDPSYGRDLEQKRARLLSLFKKHGVQLVMSGHDHLFQHNTLNWGPGKKMHFLVVGGGGAPLRTPKTAQELDSCRWDLMKSGLDVAIESHEDVHHYLQFKFIDQKLSIEVIEVTGDAEEPTRLFTTINIESG